LGLDGGRAREAAVGASQCGFLGGGGRGGAGSGGAVRFVVGGLAIGAEDQRGEGEEGYGQCFHGVGDGDGVG